MAGFEWRLLIGYLAVLGLLFAGGQGAVATDLIGGAQPTMLSPEEAQKAFRMAEGYQIKLFASEENFPIESPCAMTFDSQGRLWVACVKSHPHARPGVEPRDSIIVLEDTDEDGAADKCTVFYDKLYLPMGFALADGGRTVYVVSQPNLLRLRDTDGDGIADEERIELHGLGTEDNHHVASAFQWGPDGRLYFAQGLFLNTQVETPHGPVRAFEGTIFRYDPRDQRLEPYGSYGWSNPWGVIFDDWGNPLVADASPGLNYYLPYMTSNFAYPKPDKYVNFTTARNQYSFTPAGRRPSCGNELLLGEHWPDEVRGWYVTNQMKGWHGLRWYKLHDEGAGIGATQPYGEGGELLTTSDITFRPTAMQMGPEGALYVLDYYNPIVGHMTYDFRDPRRLQTFGRVWRITHESGSLIKQPEVRGETTENLLKILESPNYRWRYFARRELQQRDRELVKLAVEEWLGRLPEDEGSAERRLLEALWVFQGLNVVDRALLERLLAAEDFRARASAYRVLRFWLEWIDPEESLSLLERAIADESQRVRLEALLACGYHADPDESIRVAASVLERDMDTGFALSARETLGYLAGHAEEVPASVERFLLPWKSDEELLACAMSDEVGWQILKRPGLGAQNYLEALRWVASVEKTSAFEAAIALMERGQGEEGGSMTGNLRGLILEWDRSSEELEVGGLRLLESEDSVVRQAGFGLLLKAGVGPERLFKLVQKMKEPGESDFLKILRRLDKAFVPEEIQRFVVDRASQGSGEVRMAAIEALPYLDGREIETVALLNEMTEGRGATALKFAALESLMRIPVRFRSGAMSGKTLTKLRVTATPDLRFEPAEFTVPAGGAVDLEFYNPDNMYHNLVIVQPGRVDEVGMAADLMAARPDGLAENYVPASDGVLFATPQLSMRKRYRLRFFAPDDVGEYEYICTFPGHWRVMRGIMKVVGVPGGDE